MMGMINTLVRSWLKRKSAHAFYRLMEKVGRTPMPRDVGDFRLLSRKAVKDLVRLREQHRFMKGLFAWIGHRQIAVPYDRDPRHAGASKWSYLKLWSFSIEGITSFTTAPLKVATYVGLAVATLALGFGALTARVRGDETWARFRDHFFPLILAAQDDDGSFKLHGNPKHHTNSVHYRTCLCTLMLEVYYRFLPGTGGGI